MTRLEKQQNGIEKARKDFARLQTLDCWKNATSFKVLEGVNGGGYVHEYRLRLYNNNAEKYANRPILMWDCGYKNITNDAYISELRTLLSKHFN